MTSNLGAALHIDMTRIVSIAAVATLICVTGVVAQRQAPPAAGDPSAGKVVFEGSGRCLACHAINERGGTVGPDLSWIGILRSDESLRTSLVDPHAHVSPEYFTVAIRTKAGERVEGIRLNEDDVSIQIRDTHGNPRSFIKNEVKDLRREPRSLMPSYRSTLSPTDISNVVSYLRSLRALPPLEPRPRSRAIPAATENTSFFDRPARDREDRPELIMPALELPSGATVADIGSGTGYFTWRLAERVGPHGKVYAVDVQDTMLDMTKAAVARHTLDNVEYVLTTGDDLPLPDGSLDLAFIAYAYHEFADPRAMMTAIRRALKPGGRMFVLEYAQESDRSPASALHAMSFDDMRGEIEPAGFVIDRVFDFLPVQHGVIFRMK
jgi:putative heme-binding domain-containing protein